MPKEILFIPLPSSYHSYFERRRRFRLHIKKFGSNALIKSYLSDIYNIEKELNPKIKRFKKLLTSIHDRESLENWIRTRVNKFAFSNLVGSKYESGEPESNEPHELTEEEERANEILDSGNNINDQDAINEFWGNFDEFKDYMNETFDKDYYQMIRDIIKEYGGSP